MPFTASHPAAILPLLRPAARYGVTSALVIGSMVPDFAYFMPWPDTRHASHTLPGLLSFCLPIGLAGVVVFEFFLRRPLTFLLPGFLRERVARPALPRLWDPRVLAASAAALLAGALTHQVWDSFTHGNGIIVEILPVARERLFTLGGYDVRVYKVFQHASTVLGAALVAQWIRAWCLRTPRRASPAGAARRRRRRALAWTAIGGLSFAVAFLDGGTTPLPRPWLHAAQTFFGVFIITGGQALAVVTVLYCALWWLRRLRARPLPA
jgi:hypothetical protein